MRVLPIVAALGAGLLAAEAGADAVRAEPRSSEAMCAPDAAAAASAQAELPEPVLVDGLGHAGVEPDSANAEARAWFAQGARLVWAFDEVEAIRAFRMAQRADPACAMCYWGEAWARGPTINLQPRSEELPAARAAAQKAAALGAGLSPRDRALVEAMLVRTGGGDAFAGDAYAAAMEAAARRFPRDDLMAVIAADARMVVTRGNLRPGSVAQTLLERVLRRNPDHGGAIHYYIHLTDWIDRQQLAVPYAERLGRIAPAASHLIHMPSHSFYGVGRYADAAAVNVAAIAADRAFVERARAVPSDYRTGLLGHNMHFAIISALARGDGATALAVSDQFRAAYLAGANVPARARIVGSATYYARGLHGDPGAVLADAAEDTVFGRAMRHYARGEALARRGDAEGVRAEAAAIAAIRGGAEAPQLGSPTAGRLVEIVQLVLEGRGAMLAGDHRAAASAYRAAMERQLTANFSSDPPLFWYSIRRSLGAALLAGGEAREARDQLRASLRRWPNDPLALYALAEAETQLGNAAAAERLLRQARAGWAGELAEVPLHRI
ncbi:MAG: hypothetical protein ACK4K7_13505 [Allosphingosinicella sp.]|uniref:hypothetical protein n=1 Tax=Allosphingosinicella sp. TaxID=2823234 RepID=UPI00395F2C7C